VRSGIKEKHKDRSSAHVKKGLRMRAYQTFFRIQASFSVKRKEISE
jgi:hypothetical protein